MREPSLKGGVREDHLYLLAGTPFEQYRDFVSKELSDSNPEWIKQIADHWRAAAASLLELQLTEPDWADHPTVQPITSEMEPLVEQVRQDPVFRKAFTMPVEIGLVELDRLVVRQVLINLAQVRRLHERLGTAPTLDRMFRMCLPFDHPIVECNTQAVSRDEYTFESDSNDLRFLKSMVLRPDQVQGLESHGIVAGIVAMIVGFSGNYVSAIAANNRLVLNNGSHRAYALRALGVQKAPCVIQRVSTPDELRRVAVGGLRKRPEFYLQEPRPPVLKDYFNPRLFKILALCAARRHVKVRCVIETYDVVKSGETDSLPPTHLSP
jgi:hypothetical protein